jgi:hypothetical protein
MRSPLISGQEGNETLQQHSMSWMPFEPQGKSHDPEVLFGAKSKRRTAVPLRADIRIERIRRDAGATEGHSSSLVDFFRALRDLILRLD